MRVRKGVCRVCVYVLLAELRVLLGFFKLLTAVTDDIRCVVPDNLRHLLRRLANVAHTAIIGEEPQADGADVLAVASEGLDRGDRAVVQPVEVRRVQIIFDDVAPIAAVVEDGLDSMRRLGRRMRRQHGIIAQAWVAAPQPD